MTKTTFVKGAIILAFTGVIVRIIGAAMRIVLAALMGDEGIGLYSYAYPIFATLLTIATAGIPVAISKLVSEKLALNDPQSAYRVFKIALLIITSSGLLISVVLALGAEFFAINIARDPRAYYPILAISPAIFFVAVMAAMRGFFQGHQLMTPTALSQFVEQIVRVVTSVGLVVLLLPISLEYAAAGAAFGAVSGGIIGLVVLVVLFYRQKSGIFSRYNHISAGNDAPNSTEVVKRIVSLSVPITLGSLMVPFYNVIDLVIVSDRLQEIGFAMERATALYGQLTGMALNLMYFPCVVIVGLTISLVPAVSEAFAQKNIPLLHNRIKTSSRLVILFSLPSAVGLFLLSLPILNNTATVLLYNNAEAAYPVTFLAWGVVFFSLYLATTGTLQGMGYALVPVKNMLLGAFVKIVLTWFLTSMPELHIGGAALATSIGFALGAFLNLLQVSKLSGFRYKIREFLFKPILSVLIMSVFVIFSYRLVFMFLEEILPFSLINGIATITCIIIGAFIYLISLLLLGWLTSDDLMSIPYVGEPILKWARKYRLMK